MVSSLETSVHTDDKLKLPRPNGRGIFYNAVELKSTEADNVSASPSLTTGEFREGGLIPQKGFLDSLPKPFSSYPEKIQKIALVINSYNPNIPPKDRMCLFCYLVFYNLYKPNYKSFSHIYDGARDLGLTSSEFRTYRDELLVREDLEKDFIVIQSILDVRNRAKNVPKDPRVPSERIKNRYPEYYGKIKELRNQGFSNKQIFLLLKGMSERTCRRIITELISNGEIEDRVTKDKDGQP